MAHLASANGSGSRLGKSRLIVGIGLVGVGAAGLLYYEYNRRKAAKHQAEMNKLFQLGPNDVVIVPLQEDEESVDVNSAKSNKPKANLAEDSNVDYHQQRGVSREVIIPREFTSGFIGKNGAHVRQLQSETNTRILSRATMENGDRIYCINGLSDDVYLAEQHVKRFISLQPVQVTKEILVPNEYVGALIGAKGDNIRSIQERSKARITVDPQPDPEIAFFAPSTIVPKTSTQVLIRGTEEQIARAKEFIQEIIDKKAQVDENRKRSPEGRTNRRVLKNVSVSADAGNLQVVSSPPEVEKINFQPDGTFEVYVPCVYDPKYFFIQVFNESAQANLNQLTEEMTEYYKYSQNRLNEHTVKVGDIVAAPFDHDKKIYRAKVVKVEEDTIQVRFVDYGDERVLTSKQLYPMKSEFLRLRFQALEGTLNMEVPKGGWTEEIIEHFCHLTYTGNWHLICAKRVESMNPFDDKICVDLFTTVKNQKINIKEELVRLIALKSKSNASKLLEPKEMTSESSAGGDSFKSAECTSRKVMEKSPNMSKEKDILPNDTSELTKLELVLGTELTGTPSELSEPVIVSESGDTSEVKKLELVCERELTGTTSELSEPVVASSESGDTSEDKKLELVCETEMTGTPSSGLSEPVVVSESGDTSEEKKPEIILEGETELTDKASSPEHDSNSKVNGSASLEEVPTTEVAFSYADAARKNN